MLVVVVEQPLVVLPVQVLLLLVFVLRVLLPQFVFLQEQLVSCFRK